MIVCSAVFDIGKTNKKFLLFDEDNKIVKEISENFEEITDEDGDNCEDLDKLRNWLLSTWTEVEADHNYEIKALNFTTYGASFVHIDETGLPVSPLYNYLKPFPEDLLERFYKVYGSREEIATATASPALGMLNSGLQLYYIKHRKPEIFKRIKVSLHLPQYLSFLFSGQKLTEFTSIGCHTALWNFKENSYHRWVREEEIDKLFAPIVKESAIGKLKYKNTFIPVGTGLHDSSSALIPYLSKFKDPFLLLSTGTWGITLNPFAKNILTKEELRKDCLNYMTFDGTPVKASRLFTGNEHEQQTKVLAQFYHKPNDHFKTVKYDPNILKEVETSDIENRKQNQENYSFGNALVSVDPTKHKTYEHAYHKFILDLVKLQTASVRLASEDSGIHKKLFVDGGFSKNPIFMNLLKNEFNTMDVEAFELAQGTALGAVLIMNSKAKVKI